MTVSPATVSVARGGAATATVTVRNTDTGPCGPSTFAISSTVTSRYPGVAMTFTGATSLTVAAGQAATTGARFTAATSTAVGTVASTRISATRPAAPTSCTASVSVSVR